MTEGSRMAGRLCWLPHIAFDSDHGWLCSQTGRAPFPAQGLSLWRKTIFRGRTQTSSSCCHWNNCLPSSPLSPVTLSRPQLVTKQKQKPNEITYKCPMCAWGFRVRREGRRGAIEVGGEGWKERGFWKERTTFFLEHQVMEGKAGTLQPRALQRTTYSLSCGPSAVNSPGHLLSPLKGGWGLSILWRDNLALWKHNWAQTVDSCLLNWVA